jgi:phage terminase large subunit GpA-like protein
MSESNSPNIQNGRFASQALEVVAKAAAEALAPERDLTVSQWADEHRYLSKKASGEGGPWRTERTPYLKAIMDELSASSPAQRIVFMKGAQIGATESGLNWIGYTIQISPAPMLSVQPTVDGAKRYSKQRLAPMIEESETLRLLVSDARERDSGNTILMKEFPGGLLVMTGANSAVGLRSMPARYVFLDEVDGYPGDVDEEGDPVALAEARTRNFQRRKIYMVSTPTIAGRSRIEKEFSKSDQRRFFLPCPECDHFQTLQFKNLKWDKGDPKSARYVCEECGCLLGNEHKTEMLRRGEWRATAEGDGTIGFHLSSLYSPVGWLSWVDIAKRWEAAQGDPDLLKAFINTVLGEVWQARGDAPEWDQVYRQREQYRAGNVPRGALILFGGVDVQKDRLEVGVWGFGRDRHRWLIEHRVLPGPTNRPEVWADLAAMFNETWRHESGAEMSVRDWGIDSGAFSPDVGAFVRAQQGRGNVFAVDGVDSYIGAFLGIGAMDLTVNGKKIKRGLKTLKIGVSYCKQEIVGQLALNKPEGDAPYPPGFVHLPADVTEDHVKQLTSESLVTKMVKGRTKREWQIIEGRRNEVLDCANYARGLAGRRRWDQWREPVFQELEALLVPPPTEPKPPTPRPLNIAPQPAGGFINARPGWMKRD